MARRWEVPSYSEPTRYGRGCLAAPGRGAHCPSAAKQPLPPRSAQLERWLHGDAGLSTLVDELKVHPWATGLATLATTLTGLNASPLWLGVEPIVADAITLAALLLAVTAWIRQLVLQPRQTDRQVGSVLLGADGSPINASAPTARAADYWRTLILLALTACLIWTLRMPISHTVQLATQGTWKVCGEFRASCGQAACIRFLDARGRPIGADCFAIQDSSGYLERVAHGWLSYRPTHVTALCGKSETRPVPIPASNLGSHCSGRMELP